MIELWGKAYTPADLRQRVGDMSQLAGAQPFELTDGPERGCRGVRLYNAAGLDMTVMTERGLSVTALSYRGVPLPFISSVGSVFPAYTDGRGLGWLRTWPGGFLTPCGLTQVGSPCTDGGEELGQHGRVASLPARNVNWGGRWQGDEYDVWVEGTVRETAVFGENLALTRRLWMRLGEPRFWIEDRVENRGFSAAPHMFLQHINLGFPLVDTTARLELPERVTEPRDDAARPGLNQCCEFGAPTAGYREQVFFHDLRPDAQGQVFARLVNPAFNGGRGLSVCLRYARADYPVLLEWKMMGQGLYVVGLEPANCYGEGRVRERERGTLVMLAPQETRLYRLEVELSTSV
jgi:hypothetical protein